MMNHVNSQIKNRRRNTVIARGKINFFAIVFVDSSRIT